jgi:hypothetical protein
MPTPFSSRLWLLLFAGLVLSLSSGCISSSAKGTRCAVVLLVSGHQVRPTFAQFQAIDQALGPSMAQRGLVLIHEMHEAEMLATIELVPRQEDPSRTDLVVREVSTNDYVRTDDSRFSPSIIESIREHNEAFRGFTRPTD